MTTNSHVQKKPNDNDEQLHSAAVSIGIPILSINLLFSRGFYVMGKAQ